MPANSWPENDSYRQLPPLSSLLYDFPDSEDAPSTSYRGYRGRRVKAAVVFIIVWSGIITLHFFAGWASWLVLALTAMLGVHILRLLLTKPMPTPAPLLAKNPENYPFISLLVAAKNEEAVVDRLVKNLCNLNYPQDRYELWVIDDNSSDRTPVILEKLAQEYTNLQVFRRSPGASGGKCGALNQVLPLSKGDFIGVFDADAQATPDLLRWVVPFFDDDRMGAVQVRKEIVNPLVNFLTRGQAAEMVLDAYLQQQRIAIGGIGELRGNGQFVRRQALISCGGWNEETITDDLDLTVRLHLDGWNIDCLLTPAVSEEAVTTPVALWHQRNRWAEGGYQRYLDYWRLLFSDRLDSNKTVDLLAFLLIQYLLPIAMVPDFIMALVYNHLPLLTPLTTLTFSLSLIGIFVGLRRVHKDYPIFPVSNVFATLMATLSGTVYMFHWFFVMTSATARMSVRAKRLKWVKTVHKGA